MKCPVCKSKKYESKYRHRPPSAIGILYDPVFVCYYCSDCGVMYMPTKKNSLKGNKDEKSN